MQRRKWEKAMSFEKERKDRMQEVLCRYQQCYGKRVYRMWSLSAEREEGRWAFMCYSEHQQFNSY